MDTNISKPKNANVWERQGDNWYVENRWVSKRLFEEVPELHEGIFDPCAGRGNVVDGAIAAGLNAIGADLRNRGNPKVFAPINFFSEIYPAGLYPVPNIASNPPYGPISKDDFDGGMIEGRKRYEEAFIELALKRTDGIVAVLLFSVWNNAEKRSFWLEKKPLWRIYNCMPRPSCPPGHDYEELVLKGKEGKGGQKDYSWYLFKPGHEGPPTVHYLRRDT